MVNYKMLTKEEFLIKFKKMNLLDETLKNLFYSCYTLGYRQAIQDNIFNRL
jgi:hypothetical protein